MSWTEQRLARLGELWGNKASMGEIAAELGTTRSAIAGKVHRLRLKREGNIVRIRLNAPVRKEPYKPPKVEVLLKDLDTIPELPRRDGFDYLESAIGTTAEQVYKLRATSCRFPIGDPRTPGFHFCCKTKEAGRPYCREHSAKAFVEQKPE